MDPRELKTVKAINMERKNLYLKQQNLNISLLVYYLDFIVS